MSHGKYLDVIPKTNPVAPVCFAVSAFAFLACLFGLIVNHWLSGWMAVGGMAGIGLFYLAIGLISLGTRIPVYSAPISRKDGNGAFSSDPETFAEALLINSPSNAQASLHRIRNEHAMERVE